MTGFFYKLTIEYDGTLYYGWQKQPCQPTIQSAIEKALSHLTNETISVVGAGRTDAGVHALNQVAHVQIHRYWEPARLLSGANALLPPDIAIKQVEPVDAAFHARYNAKRKIYRYLIYNGVPRSPHLSQTAWHYAMPLHLPKMRATAKKMVGQHDFTSFAATDNDSKNHCLDLEKIDIKKKQDQIAIVFTAPRFLRQMVRNIVGLLVEVGRGHRSTAEIDAILEARDRRLAGPTAPAHGLCLIQIDY